MGKGEQSLLGKIYLSKVSNLNRNNGERFNESTMIVITIGFSFYKISIKCYEKYLIAIISTAIIHSIEMCDIKKNSERVFRERIHKTDFYVFLFFRIAFR